MNYEILTLTSNNKEEGCTTYTIVNILKERPQLHATFDFSIPINRLVLWGGRKFNDLVLDNDFINFPDTKRIWAPETAEVEKNVAQNFIGGNVEKHIRQVYGFLIKTVRISVEHQTTFIVWCCSYRLLSSAYPSFLLLLLVIFHHWLITVKLLLLSPPSTVSRWIWWLINAVRARARVPQQLGRVWRGVCWCSLHLFHCSLRVRAHTCWLWHQGKSCVKC